MPKPDESLENVSPEDLELARIARELAAGKDTRKDFLRLLKKHNPAQPIPELDTEQAMLDFAKPQLEKLDKLERRFIEKEAENRVLEKRAALRDQGFSKDDVAAIEKLMVEKQIPSHETAAEHFRMSKQLATPTAATLNRTGTNTLPINKEAIKKAGGIRNFAREEAYRAADDIKAGRVKLH